MAMTEPSTTIICNGDLEHTMDLHPVEPAQRPAQSDHLEGIHEEE